MRILLTLLLAGAGLAACATPPAGDTDDLSWVWILTGPKDAEVVDQARAVAFDGHFANMTRMAEAGDLYLSGPFFEPVAQADHRGIFVLATDDLAAAQDIADSDPTAQAGIFVFEIEAFRTADDLAPLNAMHEAAAAAQGASDPPPGFHARAYVLVEGWPAKAAREQLGEDGVLFAGEIGDGPGRRWLACLDADSPEAAQAMIGEGVAEWRVMPWFASVEVTNLRADG
ncbi:MAG: YciI family protein [Planctomycetota bacterium]|jgi:uncharacterized protein YciI